MVYACRRAVVQSFLTRHVPAIAVFVLAALPATAPEAAAQPRMSEDLARKLLGGDHTDSSVIFTGTQAEVDALAARHGLTIRKRLRTGAVLTVKAGRLATVADDPAVMHLASDHPVFTQMDVTNQTIGADQVQAGLAAAGIPGLTGEGIGVAVIDSGVAPVPELKPRIVASVDFTDGKGAGRDEHGHGTHVAGIIAASGGNPHDDTRGVAPGAHIISLKVLDAQGRGLVGNVIAAIDWAIQNRERFNIRVMNLSLGGPVLQSWRLDPLCQAVERAYRAGISVVASAGNFGRRADGTPLRSGVTVPGNSPFAITVGAANTKGTAIPSDDSVAAFSSRGLTHIDRTLKPDLVAPGNKIRGLAVPGTTLWKKYPELVTQHQGAQRIYLSGTSMAAAAVSGAAAVLLQHGPLSTPLALRFALQVGASSIPGGLAHAGAGSVNLARSVWGPKASVVIATQQPLPQRIVFADTALLRSTSALEASSDPAVWGESVLWGAATVRAWADGTAVVLGQARTVVWGEGGTVVWGDAIPLFLASSDDTVVWGEVDTVVWGEVDTVVWGELDTVVWGEDETVVWGEADDTVVWGETDETVVWGEADETVVWGE
jgi:serine protease AprX